MAGSGDGQLSHSHHCNVGAVPYKEKDATNSASISNRNAYSALSKKYPRICQWIPNPNPTVPQNKLRVLKGNRPSEKDACQLPKNRNCPEQSKPRIYILSGDGHGDKQHEEEVGPGLCKRTYLTDSILNLEEGEYNEGRESLSKCIKQDISRRVTETVNLEHSPLLNGENPSKKCNTKSWSPPKGFWKVLGMENIKSVVSAEKFEDEILPEETWNINELEISNVHCRYNSEQKSVLENFSKVDGLGGSVLKRGERTVENTHKLGHLGGLWRTDSWESVSSNASLLSLTERVEHNRTNLKRMLTSLHPKRGPGIGIENLPQESLAPSSYQFSSTPLDDRFPRNKYIKQGCGINENDSDWDSEISLQQSDRGMSRGFVFSKQLPLSPRHELAKQLLERARRKARASPLKADHSILPVVKSSMEIGTNGVSSPKKGLFSRKGRSLNTQTSCNISDSSSAESHCGLRKKLSQSPSHVRFEDESTQEAEVRYQFRRKCGLESSVRPIPRGLIQKPGIPSYGNPGKEHMSRAESGNCNKSFNKNAEITESWSWKSAANPISTGATGENQFGKASRPHVNTAMCIDGKCSCCGSYIISGTKAICLDPPSYEFPDVSVLKQCSEPQRPSYHELPISSAMEVETNLGTEAPDVGVFPPRIVPCWVLPSQHRIRIEPIKETYIGEITSIDDVSVTEENATDTAFQEMKEFREPKIVTYCCAIISGSNDSSIRNNVELNAKGIRKSTRCTGENSVEKEPVSIVADCNLKSRRKPIKRQEDGLQSVHCQISSIQELRDCAESDPMASVLMSKHSHISRLPTEQVVEVTPFSAQLDTSLCPFMKSVQSSKHNTENSTLHCSSLPQQKDTSSLRNRQVKEIPAFSHAHSRSRMPNSHSMNILYLTQFEENTSDQDSLPKRPMINKVNVTIQSNSQQNQLPPTQKNNPLIQLDTCTSQYRLIHLNPEENNGRPSDSQVVPETLLLQPQHSPTDPDQNLPNNHTDVRPIPSANPSLNSAIRMPRNNNGDYQSSEGYRSEVWKNSEISEQVTDMNDGLLTSEHKTAIKHSKNQNCLIDPNRATVSSSKQKTEKQKDRTESQPAAVRIQPQDSTSSWESLTSLPTLLQEEDSGLPKLPQPATRDGEPLLPVIGTADCRDRPIHHPDSKPSDDNQLPLTSKDNARTQHFTDSQHKHRSFMKAFFTTIRHNTVSKLNRLRSSSMEQINCQSTGDMSGDLRCEKTSGHGLRKTPSLQSLRLVSPLAQLRKASSIQSLHSQSKKKRCSSYLVGEMMETGLGSSEQKTSGCRLLTPLSVEDIGSPNHPRFIGQVMETFADGSLLLQLYKPAHGPFGFFISRSRGGIFIHQMADKNAEKLYSGLLEPGDEVLEVNGERVEGLSFNEVNSLMLQDNTVSIRVRRHNVST
ncbi:uncharacterized protein KIAA1614 homolog [Amblyraja radiata]|uniref:uncharacterized protein KIAA1614 homolog n=1 Tax=Amblyraja radiata TaxID=386614 RepID=UPI0014039C9F|nr:uncharacterized protein KIAA1614 homolog [Amblyraja radiata]